MSPNGTPKTVPNDRMIRTVALADVGRQVKLWKPFLILKYGHDSAHALLEALRVVRQKRKARRGALTDEEQDLLRAMLVMAASGLDSMTKQLIRDALPVFCRKDPTVLTSFQTFVSRQLKRDADGHLSGETSGLLARLLTAESVQSASINEYVESLTGGSLQSTDALFRVVGALGIPHTMIDEDRLKPIFDDRNDIIHGLDIDFEAPRRNRHSRTMGDMIRATNWLLLLAEEIYTNCENKLNQVQPTTPPDGV